MSSSFFARVLGLVFLFLSGFCHEALAQQRVSANGQVYFGNTPLCALVLVNGQSQFTCGGEGRFNLDVPLDADGLLSLQVFAAGFGPVKQVLTPAQGKGVRVDMGRVQNGRSFHVQPVIVAGPPGRAQVSGTVTSGDAPICALVLANGQQVFTCAEPLGEFFLEVPLDENGEVTLMLFAQGFQPYKQVLSGDQSMPQRVDVVGECGGTYRLTSRTNFADDPSVGPNTISTTRQYNHWCNGDSIFSGTITEQALIANDARASLDASYDLTVRTRGHGLRQSGSVSCQVAMDGATNCTSAYDLVVDGAPYRLTNELMENDGGFVLTATLTDSGGRRFEVESASLFLACDNPGSDPDDFIELSDLATGEILLTFPSCRGEAQVHGLAVQQQPQPGPWTGDWRQVNFLSVDDNGQWDEDNPDGIGFVATIDENLWLEEDEKGVDGCRVSYTYMIDDQNRYSKVATGVGTFCPNGYQLGPHLSGTGLLEFQDGGNTMNEYYDRIPGDGIAAFRWRRVGVE